MRTLYASLFVLSVIPAASAQTVLKREPHYLAPGAVAFVDSGQCGVGKVMKVTGILKGTSRRKACVIRPALEAALQTPPAL